MNRPGAIVLLAVCVACEPTVDVELVLVNECIAQDGFEGTESVQVSLVGEAEFGDDGQLLGCLRDSICVSPTERIEDVETLRTELREQGQLISAAPGAGQAIVLTGFADNDCAPTIGNPDPIRFCGHHVGTFTEDTEELFVLVGCGASVDRDICWPAQFLETCSE